MERFDCAVIGSGPAGLSAAINLRQRGKTACVLGAAPGFLSKAEQVDNYLGLPGVTGNGMIDQFLSHAKEMGIIPLEGRAANILPAGDYFMINFNGEIMESKTVILACGIARAKPIPGEAELLGRGVSYCATCDGMLYRGKKILVWGLSPEAAHEANFLASIGCSVTFVAAKQPPELKEEIRFIPGTVKAVGGEPVVKWAQIGAVQEEFEGVFILRSAIAPDTLLPGLALENGSIVVNRSMETNIPGVYAAGDVTGAPLQVAKAVSEGLIAALSVADYLDRK